jgi:hypothetical protein
MKNKKRVLLGLFFLLVGVAYFSVQAIEHKGLDRANFSGTWKTEESISMGGNIFCSFIEGDRMNVKTLKIAEKANFLTIETNAESKSAKIQEKLSFNVKGNQGRDSLGIDKKYTVKLSVDRKTMTVNSVVQQMVPTPYHVDVQKKAISYVTEVWHLSQDGKSISVRSKAKSTLWGGERAWVTVFEKVI